MTLGSVSSGTASVVDIVLSARPKSLLLSYRNSGLLEYHLPLQNEAPKIGLLVVDTDTNVTSWTTSCGDFSQSSPADYAIARGRKKRKGKRSPSKGISQVVER
ncbi:hypothetical protein R1flu_028895 [Riccia fluitans]|uniref:Uncharacterized protein n=1 Tax=Riccia fluitans TaxID=41844 RepID=A0ABD1XMZ8_9MARC